MTSLILYFLYQNTSYNTKITGAAGFIFFLLLSIRFGFWFYSRVMRASIAAGHQQSIAWVEFGYYIGMVLGLIIWKLFNINLELGTALLIDATFQLIAGGLDLKNFTLDKNSLEASKQEARPKFDKKAGNNHSTWLWSLTSAVVFLTIGVQVVIFNTAHYVTEVFGSYLLATFYLGVALAAFVCNKYNIHIAWENKNQIAAIIVNHSKKTYRISFMLMMLMLAFAVIIVIININGVFVCAFVFASAFIYEICSISLIDRIGHEEKNAGVSGMIMRTYGLMGLGSAIGFWMLGLMRNYLMSSFFTLAFCLVLVATGALRRNHMLFDKNDFKHLKKNTLSTE